MERRLAAILAADVVGYSRLMAQDESGTLLRVQTQIRDVLEPLIVARGGRIVKLMGDGLLADFQSAVHAVSCAVDIQAAAADQEQVFAPANRLTLRIGINLGDIIDVSGDIFGDGVNIAARLESLADPGGICISGTAFDTVEGKLGLEFEDLGPQSVKNIARPIRAYRVKPAQGGGASSGLPVSDHPRLPDRPSIAVLPFANASADPDQRYFADGITEDIITNLAGCRWIFVIARNSTLRYGGGEASARVAGRELGVRYVLEGSVRRSGPHVRISCQLIEAESGVHLWAERHDRTMTDVFELQDDITRKVVAALEPTLKKAEINRIARKRPDDLDAYELYLRALQHMYDIRPDRRAEALAFAERALAIAPSYAEAHGVAAWCHFARSLWEGSLPDPHREAMLRHVRAVQDLDTDDASTLAHAAIGLSLATRDHAVALAMIDRALASNPSSAHAYGHGSVINTWAGNYDKSVEMSDAALRLSPFDPLRVMPLAGQAGARLMMGDLEGAIGFAARALQIYPTHTPSFLISIAAMVRLARMEEAVQMGKRLMAASPGYQIIPNAPILGHFVSELRAAGLPERRS